MAYTKTTWLDRAVQFARRFTKSGETSSSVTLTQDPGTVTQAGTPINAANLNKLEQGVFDAHVTADAALPKAGGTMTGTLVVPAITLAGTALPQTRLNGQIVEVLIGGSWRPVSGDSAYTNLVTYAQPATASVLTNIVNISGKAGYLSSAFILNLGSYSANTQFQITIDGVIKFDVKATGSGSNQKALGVIQDTSFVPGTGGYNPRGAGNPTPVAPYPYITTQADLGVVSILPGPIYFSNSLAVAINTVGANVSVEVKYATT